MTGLIPNRFLFSFEFPLRYRPDPPVIDGHLSGWTDAEILPRLGEIDGQTDFADVRACWNEAGLYFACRVADKHQPLRCDPRRFQAGDNLRICTDMRGARTARRATRFCQQFYFLPTGGGARRNEPVAGVTKIQRAREDAPAVPVGRIAVASRVTRTGYTLEARIPGECLNGFEPAEHPRIGFHYMLEDGDHGQQYLTVGDDLNWDVDPSTWASAALRK